MSVYVDLTGHLVADTLDELHGFAAELGLKREWFQGDPTGEKGRPRPPHYDLTTLGMIQKAIRRGARKVDPRTIARVSRKLRSELRRRQLSFPH